MAYEIEDYADLIAELAKQGNEVAEFTDGDPVEFRAISALEEAVSRIRSLEGEYGWKLLDSDRAEHEAGIAERAWEAGVSRVIDWNRAANLTRPTDNPHHPTLSRTNNTKEQNNADHE